MYQILSNAIFNGDQEKSKEIARQLLKNGVSALEIIEDGLFPGMDLVGKKFKADEIYLPEVLVSAYSMQEVLGILKPLLAKSNYKSKGIVVLGTVQGDIHNIGKDMVGMMLEGGGFTVINVGVDITPLEFVKEVKSNKADILALSTLLTTTVPAMRDTIQAVRKDNQIKNTKIIVGGVPLNKEYAEAMRADGYGQNAGSVVDIALELLG